MAAIFQYGRHRLYWNPTFCLKDDSRQSPLLGDIHSSISHADLTKKQSFKKKWASWILLKYIKMVIVLSEKMVWKLIIYFGT